MDGRTTLMVAGGGVFVAGAILALVLSSRSSVGSVPGDPASEPSTTVETDPTTALPPPTTQSPPPWAPTSPPPPPNASSPGSSTTAPVATAPHMIGDMPPGLHVQPSPASPFCKPGVYIDDAGVARKRYCK